MITQIRSSDSDAKIDEMDRFPFWYNNRQLNPCTSKTESLLGWNVEANNHDGVISKTTELITKIVETGGNRKPGKRTVWY